MGAKLGDKLHPPHTILPPRSPRPLPPLMGGQRDFHRISIITEEEWELHIIIAKTDI